MDSKEKSQLYEFAGEVLLFRMGVKKPTTYMWLRTRQKQFGGKSPWHMCVMVRGGYDAVWTALAQMRWKGRSVYDSIPLTNGSEVKAA